MTLEDHASAKQKIAPVPEGRQGSEETPWDS